MDISVQSEIGGQTVGSHRASRRNGLSDEPVQRGPGHVRDRTKTDAADALSILLSCSDHHGLEFRPPADGTRFLSAPVGLVHLDDAIQSVAARADHGPAQFMQHRPRRLVTAQAENALQTQSAAVLLAGHLPHGGERDRQRQATVLKDGPRFGRHLVPAMVA